MMRSILASGGLIVLTACTTSLAPATPVSEAGVNLPAAYDYAGEVETISARDEFWWLAFEAETLDALIDEALVANQTRAQGLANIRASRAALQITNAAFLPQASGSLSASSNTEGGGLDDIDASGSGSAS